MKYKALFTLTMSLLLVTSCSKDVPTPKEVNIDVAGIETTVSIHSENQKALLDSSDPAALIDNNISDYGHNSLSKPLPVSFSWAEENDLNQKASKYILRISEYQDMSCSLEYKTNESSFDVYNLQIKTQYYYQVTSIHSSKKFNSEVKQFTINDSGPRNLFVDGVENVRDLGGWGIGNNKTYRQGLIYRTAQFNLNSYGSEFNSVPTKEGKNTLLNELKIKTEIDLRRTEDTGCDENDGITSSPLGKSVKYVSAPMIYGNANIFTQSRNLEYIRLFFDTLADENNYPIAFHCVRGTDRTGALAYVLGALVGMSKEDLMLDYLFSDLANIGNPVQASTISGDSFYVQGIDSSEGTTLSEKAKNYLHNTVGVEISTLETIIDILTE